jgi:hypothetical protein
VYSDDDDIEGIYSAEESDEDEDDDNDDEEEEGNEQSRSESGNYRHVVAAYESELDGYDDVVAKCQMGDRAMLNAVYGQALGTQATGVEERDLISERVSENEEYAVARAQAESAWLPPEEEREEEEGAEENVQWLDRGHEPWWERN